MFKKRYGLHNDCLFQQATILLVIILNQLSAEHISVTKEYF